MKYWIIPIAIVLIILGCRTVIDPDTGEEFKVLDPNHPAVVVGETAAEGGAAVSPLFGPIGGVVSTLLLTGLGYWKKVKPKLAQAETKAEQSYAVSATLVGAMEHFKKTHPGHWDNLKGHIETQMSKQGVDPKTIENVIRGLRGLPAKV